MMCNFYNNNTVVGKMHDFLLWAGSISSEEWEKHSDVDFEEALRIYGDEVEFWLNGCCEEY